MKHLFLALAFITTSSFAQVDGYDFDKKQVLKILKFTDSRIDLNSCGSNEGTFGFHNPTKTTVFNCQGQIVQTKQAVLVFKSKGTFSYFEVKNCGERDGFGMQEGGMYIQKCEVRSLDTETLEVNGPKRVVTYDVSWEYSAGTTHIGFKYNHVNYSGVLVDFSTLMYDRE